ncbi:hypothetical protein JXQ31_11335 [candidate division KSB1 bacterium]|nr:hypothetical protein [candidate division KSB1 bacterium]
MKVSSDLLILFIGFIAIIIITRMIAGKISKHLSKKVSVFTYVLAGLLGIYYLLDVIFHSAEIFDNVYFYFWFLVIVVQAVFFIRAINRYSKKKQLNFQDNHVD